jgi:hypothetical protein
LEKAKLMHEKWLTRDTNKSLWDCFRDRPEARRQTTGQDRYRPATEIVLAH